MANFSVHFLKKKIFESFLPFFKNLILNEVYFLLLVVVTLLHKPQLKTAHALWFDVRMYETFFPEIQTWEISPNGQKGKVSILGV